MSFLTALTILCSIVVMCITAIICIKMQHEFDEKCRDTSNHLELDHLLQEKLKAMEDLKERMEMLLIKNGLGRK